MRPLKEEVAAHHAFLTGHGPAIWIKSVQVLVQAETGQEQSKGEAGSNDKEAGSAQHRIQAIKISFEPLPGI
jgi:hypothetical protein